MKKGIPIKLPLIDKLWVIVKNVLCTNEPLLIGSIKDNKTKNAMLDSIIEKKIYLLTDELL